MVTTKTVERFCKQARRQIQTSDVNTSAASYLARTFRLLIRGDFLLRVEIDFGQLPFVLENKDLRFIFFIKLNRSWLLITDAQLVLVLWARDYNARRQ